MRQQVGLKRFFHKQKTLNSRYKSFKGKKKDVLNYNNDEEGLDVLRKLSIMAKLKAKLKFRVSFFSNIDSKVNICKRIKLSTYTKFCDSLFLE